MNRSILFLLVFNVLFLLSCELEKVEYPVEPQIEFMKTSVEINQNPLGQDQINIKLTFYLIDGDGDVGLLDFDTVSPYDANFFPSFYKVEDGKMNLDTTFIADKYRIPWVGDLGQDKALKAEISVDFEYPYSEQFPFPHDSILYSFYMLDRSLNSSNIAWTDTIVIDK